MPTPRFTFAETARRVVDRQREDEQLRLARERQAQQDAQNAQTIALQNQIRQQQLAQAQKAQADKALLSEQVRQLVGLPGGQASGPPTASGEFPQMGATGLHAQGIDPSILGLTQTLASTDPAGAVKQLSGFLNTQSQQDFRSGEAQKDRDLRVSEGAKERKSIQSLQSQQIAAKERTEKEKLAAKQGGLSAAELEFRKAQAKETGKNFGEQFVDIQKQSVAASKKVGRLKQASLLVEKLDTGPEEKAQNVVRKLGSALGMEVNPNLPLGEALTALSIGFTLTDAVQETKGAVSNKEMELFLQVAPSLSNTREGNKLIIEFMTNLAERQRSVAKLARDYKASTGKFDEGFTQALDEFDAANPLISEEFKERVDAITQPQPDFSGVTSESIDSMSEQELDAFIRANGG